MRLFDLHCDTIPKLRPPEQTLVNSGMQLSIDALPDAQWSQMFAIWIPPEHTGEAATAYFEKHAAVFMQEMARHENLIVHTRGAEETAAALAAGKRAAMLAVEDGSVLAGELENITLLARYGVRCLTLTWNGENELGYGASAPDLPLKPFGEACVRALEAQDILVDVSHLSRAGFWSVAQTATRPFIASHSGAAAVCEHPRNLTDAQIDHIIAAGGLIGMVFYPLFVGASGSALLDGLCDHMQHILRRGGEHVLALGSDFDGADMDPNLAHVSQLPQLYERVKGRFGPRLAEKIFFENAAHFFRRYETRGEA